MHGKQDKHRRDHSQYANRMYTLKIADIIKRIIKFEVQERCCSMKKYPIEKDFKIICLHLPFSKPFMKFAMPAQRILLKCVNVPKNLTSSVLKISGYKGDSFHAEFFEPAQQQKALPCILMIHGGAFGLMASPHHKKLAIRYAQELGCKVLFPDYHLMPDYPYPAGKEDVLSCYRYLCEHKDQLGIDINRIAVAGDSVGAVLAVYVAQFDWKDVPSPCGQMLVYPVTDAGQKTKSMQEYTDTPMWNAKSNAKMWKWYLAGTAETEKRNASP